MDEWRIFCLTDSKWTYGWSESSPTTCFENNSHSVNLSSQKIETEGSLNGSSVRIEDNVLKVNGIEFSDEVPTNTSNKMYKKDGGIFIGDEQLGRSNYFNITSIDEKSKNSSYTSVYEFIYEKNITAVKVLSYAMKNMRGYYYIRLYNITESNVVFEGKFNNTNKDIVDLGTIINSPTVRSNLDFQIKTDDKKNVFLKSALLYY